MEQNTQTGPEMLHPKNDFLFKLIFGDQRNESILKAFLQAALDLPSDDFAIEFLNPFLKQEYDKDKYGILDVRLRTADNVIDIEIQVARQDDIEKRAIWYKSKMVTEQLAQAQPYSSLKKVVLIFITNFDCITNDPDKTRYHHCFKQYDKNADIYFGDIEETHIMELSKLPAKEDGSPLCDWLFFINAEDKEDFMKAATKSPAIRDAVDVVRKASSDEATRWYYFQRENAERDKIAQLDYARKEGRKEGKQEGRQEYAAELRKLLDSGVSIEQLRRQIANG
jgi:predicted transposase/invertase (TIGR01784 family)